MELSTHAEGNELKAELIGLYTKIKVEAEEYIGRKVECARLGIAVLAEHRWAVVIDAPGYGMAISLADRSYSLRSVRGHLTGTSLFSRSDANKVAADWSARAPASLKAVKVVLDDDLVAARKADAETQIAFLNGLNGVPNDEVRPHDGYRVLSSEMGRTRVVLICPFCTSEVAAYLWSLAGSGKKCSCGAVLSMHRARRPVKAPKAAKA